MKPLPTTHTHKHRTHTRTHAHFSNHTVRLDVHALYQHTNTCALPTTTELGQMYASPTAAALLIGDSVIVKTRRVILYHGDLELLLL